MRLNLVLLLGAVSLLSVSCGDSDALNQEISALEKALEARDAEVEGARETIQDLSTSLHLAESKNIEAALSRQAFHRQLSEIEKMGTGQLEIINEQISALSAENKRLNKAIELDLAAWKELEEARKRGELVQPLFCGTTPAVTNPPRVEKNEARIKALEVGRVSLTRVLDQIQTGRENLK